MLHMSKDMSDQSWNNSWGSAAQLYRILPRQTRPDQLRLAGLPKTPKPNQLRISSKFPSSPVVNKQVYNTTIPETSCWISSDLDYGMMMIYLLI